MVSGINKNKVSQPLSSNSNTIQDAYKQKSLDDNTNVTVDAQRTLQDIEQVKTDIKPVSKTAVAGMVLGWLPVAGTALNIAQRVSLGNAIQKLKDCKNNYPQLAPLLRKVENLAKDARTSSNFGIPFGMLPFIGAAMSASVYQTQQLAINELDRVRDVVNLYKGNIPMSVIEKNIDRQENAQNMRLLASAFNQL